MPTLLLRLAGPLQSWGVSSKFDNRTSGHEPSRSGVIGMLASALGMSREDPLDVFSGLRFGVRIDQPGTVIHDFHTVHHPTNTNLKYITARDYLADAVFVVGLEGDSELLSRADAALRNPVYPLFLGRRSCPPSGPVSLGIRDLTLTEALEREPWAASEWFARMMPAEVSLETVCDSAEEDDGYFTWDMPVSFSQERREYTLRKVTRTVGAVVVDNSDRTRLRRERETDHDVFSELMEG